MQPLVANREDSDSGLLLGVWIWSLEADAPKNSENTTTSTSKDDGETKGFALRNKLSGPVVSLIKFDACATR